MFPEVRINVCGGDKQFIVQSAKGRRGNKNNKVYEERKTR